MKNKPYRARLDEARPRKVSGLRNAGIDILRAKDRNSKLFKSKYAAAFQKELESSLGTEKCDKITHLAVRNFEALKEKYPCLLKKEKLHCYSNIFPVIAFYKALQKNRVDSAVAILENGAAKIARKKGKAYAKIVSLPGMKGFFLRIFSRGAKTLFGKPAGFRQEFITENKNCLEFHITKCPYHFYCEEEGCRELVHIFCKNDDYAYGSLPGITFIRTKTLGNGGELCDFKFRRQPET